jgi:hypothetical protein
MVSRWETSPRKCRTRAGLTRANAPRGCEILLWRERVAKVSSGATSYARSTVSPYPLSVRAPQTPHRPRLTRFLQHTVCKEDAEQRNIRRGAVTPGSLPDHVGGCLWRTHGSVRDGGRPVAGNGRE